MLFRTLVLKASALPFIQKFVRSSRLFRPVVNRFIAGETLEEAIATAERLANEGFLVTLDLLGENVATIEEANASTEAYLELIRRLANSPHGGIRNISIKLTALGLDQSEELAEANYRRLLTEALPSGTFIRADMEGSNYTQVTIDMVRRVRQDFPNTGTVLQSYLYRTDSDLELLIKEHCRLRIVKGAYLEPASIAHADKKVVDAKYLEHSQKLLQRGYYPAIATHDQTVVDELLGFIKSKSINAEGFEWQMLYGIRRDLQAELKAHGFNVRIYLPFGDAWYPYFSRRLAERPANILFIVKSLIKK